VLALNDPAQVVLAHDHVNTPIWAVAASRFHRVALCLIEASHKVFEFAPRHCLNVPHRLMQLQQSETPRPQ
jgi:hypothetical protein